MRTRVWFVGAAALAIVAGGASARAAVAIRHCSVDTVLGTTTLGEHDFGCLVDTGSDGQPNGIATTAAPYIGISAPHTITAGKPFTFTIVAKKPVCKPGLALKELCVEAWSGELRNIQSRGITLAATSAKPSAAYAGQNYGDLTGAPERNRTLTCRAVIPKSALLGSGAHVQWVLGASVVMFGPGTANAGAELEVPVVIVP